MELLKDLYRISSPSDDEKEMINFITGKLDGLDVPYTVDSHGNIYATKGVARTYPCVVAHTDEVHPQRGDGYTVLGVQDIIIGYDGNRKRMAGIGADDKNGIWICLKCLEEFKTVKCAFFTGEEIGCIGSGQADMDFFRDCRFVLQCDRKGNSDLITSISGVKLCSREFIQAVAPKDHGYAKTDGLQTDVLALKRRGLGVSCVNISCGYYNPHTSEEYTVVEDLQKCLSFVRHIITDCTEIYPHRYSLPKMSSRNFYGGRGYGAFGYPRYYDDMGDDLFPGHRHHGYSRTRTVDYQLMYNDFTQRLSFNPDLTFEELVEFTRGEYPTLRYDDFSRAYTEITGLL